MQRSSSGEYRLLLGGRAISSFGEELCAVAAIWLVHELGESSLRTDTAGFLWLAPQLPQAAAGPIIDKLSYRPILVWSQADAAGLLLMVPLVGWTSDLTVYLVLGTIPLTRLVSQFSNPAVIAAVRHIVQAHTMLTARAPNAPAGRVAIEAAVATIPFWLGTATAGSAAVAVGAFALAWVPLGALIVVQAAAVQAATPPHLAGRVSSLAASVAAGATPAGFLIGGALASATSAPMTVGAGIAGFVGMGLVWLYDSRLRNLPSPGVFAAGRGEPR